MEKKKEQPAPRKKAPPGPAQEPGKKVAKPSETAAEVKKQADKLKDTDSPGDDGKNKDLFGGEIDGKLLTTTCMIVAVRKLITGVDLRTGDGKYRFIKGEIRGEGTTIEEATKDFKKSYRTESKKPQ